MDALRLLGLLGLVAVESHLMETMVVVVLKKVVRG